MEMEKHRYVASHNSFMNRWEVWRGNMLMGVFAHKHVAEEVMDMWNDKAGFNEGENV